MERKVRIILTGCFQCSPEEFQREGKTIVIESNKLAEAMEKGYFVVAAEICDVSNQSNSGV